MSAGCHRPHVLFKGFSLPIGDSSLPHTLLLLFAAVLELHSYSRAEARALEEHNSSDLLRACNKIAEAISNASQVFFPRERVILLFCDAPV